MLKTTVFLSFFIVLSITWMSLAAEEHEVIPILKSDFNKYEDGGYNVQYETGDGTKREESATILNAGTEDEALEVKGSYRYINADGEEVEVTYTAGKNGFVPYSTIIDSKISEVAEAAKNLPNDVEAEREKEYTRVSRQPAGSPKSQINLDVFVPPK